MYGVGGGLLAAIKAFYKESDAGVRVDRGGVTEWFSVKVGLCQGCHHGWLICLWMGL